MINTENNLKSENRYSQNFIPVGIVAFSKNCEAVHG